METEPITVTDSLGTFQAENPDTIPATLRKRKKERERLDALQLERHEKARTIATVRGFHVLSMLRRSRGMRGVAVLQDIDAETFPVLRVEPKRGHYSSYSVETENGSAVVSFDCMERITQTVIDAMGFPWLLFTVDDYENRGTVRAYAIGVFQDSHALVSLPNVYPSDFMEPQPETVSGS